MNVLIHHTSRINVTWYYSYTSDLNEMLNGLVAIALTSSVSCR